MPPPMMATSKVPANPPPDRCCLFISHRFEFEPEMNHIRFAIGFIRKKRRSSCRLFAFDLAWPAGLDHLHVVRRAQLAELVGGQGIGDKRMNLRQMRDLHRRRALELQPVRHQDHLARVFDNGLADFHFAIIEIEQCPVLVDRRGADDGGIDLELPDEVDRARAHHRTVGPPDDAAGHDHLDGRVAVEQHRDIEVVGDDQQLLMAHEIGRHLFRRGADVDEERALVGNERCRRLAGRALLLRRDDAPRLVGAVLDAGGDHRPAMDAVQQPAVAQVVEVLADGLRRDVEAHGKVVDADPPRGARQREYFVLPMAEVLHPTPLNEGRLAHRSKAGQGPIAQPSHCRHPGLDPVWQPHLRRLRSVRRPHRSRNKSGVTVEEGRRGPGRYSRYFLRSASMTRGETNWLTSPPSLWISFTKREEMNWLRSEAIRNTVSISGLRRAFMPVIWNSYSKSVTARRPRMITLAFICSAKCMSRLSKVTTSMLVEKPFLASASSPFSSSARSSTEKIGPFPALTETAMISLSTSLTARRMMSTCPLVTGSNVPG